MKPIRLVLQAFGSYPNELDVDFVRLGRHGVFSITGPTGAGKTTIFDAMVYALYGELPGKRDVADVRSDYASEADDTFVRFEFEVKGERWVIERTPSRERPKTRGTGTTTTLAAISLRRSEDLAGGYSKIREVNAKVEELIGLTRSQFQQVILLPQGEFEAVLKAETKDRTEILRRLFPVSIFKDFTEQLKRRADELRRELEGLQRFRSLRLEQIRRNFTEIDGQLAPDAERTWRLESLEPEAFKESYIASFIEGSERHTDDLRTKTAGAQLAVDELGAELATIRQAIDDFDVWQRHQERAKSFGEEEAADAGDKELLTRAREVNTVAESLRLFQQARTEVARLEEGVANALATLKKRWLTAIDLPVAYDRSTLEEVARSAVTRRDALAGAASEQRAIRDAAKGLTTKAKELKTRQAAIAKMQQRLDDEKRNEARLDELLTTGKGAGKSLNGKQRALDKLDEEFERAQRRDQVVKSLAKAEKDVTAADKAVAKADGALVKARAVRERDAAALLASTLVAGEACAVCGATEHPRPAKPAKASGDDIDLSVLEVSWKDSVKKQRRAQSVLDRLRGEEESFAKVRETDIVREELDAIRAEVDELTAAAEAYEEQLAEREATREEVKELTSSIASLALDIAGDEATLAAQVAENEKQIANFEAEFGSLEDFWFKPESWDVLLALLNDVIGLTTERDNALGDERAARLALTPLAEKYGVNDLGDLAHYALSADDIAAQEAILANREAERAQIRRDLALYEAAGKPTERPNSDALEARHQVAKDQLAQQTGALGVITQLLDTIKSDYAALGAEQDGIEEQQRVVQEVNTLHLLCSGQSAANNEVKIALEEWVLSDYLKQVLQQANARLLTMTGGRYRLQVNSMVGDQRGRHGLDLEVFDANTGKSRWARTMSGGETFKAALALALGLADVVAGSNRELGALFIDEGFGSLDPDSLETVIQVLDSLLDGGRMVGVISHVEEMKQSIPRGITVASTDRGSVATVHYPDEF